MKKEVFISLIAIAIIPTACSGSGPQYPFDPDYRDSSDMAQEFEEGLREAKDNGWRKAKN